MVAEVGDALTVMSDLCLDEFTDHGHCGVLTPDGKVDNDRTLAAYAEMARAQAHAGVDMVGPSGMMDGQVAVVRAALDAAEHTDVSILAYSAKYASAFFGPFREAVDSSLVGDRRTYQQDPANAREGVREALLDVEQGADIVMVKPALAYLDVVRRVRDAVDVPVAAYNVSGEYAMLEAAAAHGWIDREPAILETLTSIRRAGADIVLTYWAAEAARLLRSLTADVAVVSARIETHDSPLDTPVAARRRPRALDRCGVESVGLVRVVVHALVERVVVPEDVVDVALERALQDRLGRVRIWSTGGIEVDGSGGRLGVRQVRAGRLVAARPARSAARCPAGRGSSGCSFVPPSPLSSPPPLLPPPLLLPLPSPLPSFFGGSGSAGST